MLHASGQGESIAALPQWAIRPRHRSRSAPADGRASIIDLPEWFRESVLNWLKSRSNDKRGNRVWDPAYSPQSAMDLDTIGVSFAHIGLIFSQLTVTALNCRGRG